MTPLAGWENFYVIVGSSAGALIGLQFVVLTLIAETPGGPRQSEAGAAFATPTVVHFGAALLLAGLQTAPWHGLGAVAWLWSLLGLGGVVFEIVVGRRMRMQRAYRPVLEDWVFHLMLPLAAYAALPAAAVLSRAQLAAALFTTAGAALLLLFVGIHNAWDAVTYHVFSRRRKSDGEQESC